MKNKKKKERGKLFKTFKILGITLGTLVGVIVIAFGGYATYLTLQYYRIEDNKVLDVKKDLENKVEVNKELSITSFNMGFGAYSHDFTFFLDSGVWEDGTVHYGTSARAFSKEEVIKNVNGSIDALKALNSDFYAIQEVDTASDRAHNVNEEQMILDNFPSFTETFAINFHSAYFLYPLYEWHGASISGLATLSSSKIESSVRKSFSVDEQSWPDKFFDLDRCFTANYIPTNNGKTLVLINLHMSAYDKGGVIRNKQITELNNFILNETNKGNYVIAAGDFNHDLLINNPDFPQYTSENFPYKDEVTQLLPDISYMFDENGKTRFDESLKLIACDNAPSCRGVDIPYIKGRTYIRTVDGFIISNNVEMIDCKTTDISCKEADRFAFSDHQPTTMTFKLK